MNNFKNRIRLNSTEDEIVNYYDKNGNKIGTVEREEGIEKGLLLKAVQIWIINRETKQVLMQERSHKKVNDPGMIDVHSVEEYYSLLSAASIDYLKIMTQNRYLAEFVCVEKYVVIF